MQDGRDGDEQNGYLAQILDGTTIGFKYFDCRGVSRVAVTTRGYAHGVFDVKTAWDGNALGAIAIDSSNIWETQRAEVSIPDGIQAILPVLPRHRVADAQVLHARDGITGSARFTIQPV